MMLEKDADGRLKRIEYRGRYLRASRTGGVALRAQTQAAGINLTANTARGMRVSTRLAKRTQAAFQNGRFVLRGRYGDGPTKLNLSKTGVSVSTKTDFGTVNWFKPRYSSVKIAGFQLRGEKAIYLNLILGLLQLTGYLLLFFVQFCVLLAQCLSWLAVNAWQWLCSGIARYRAIKLKPLETRWLKQLETVKAEVVAAAIDLVFLELASGRTIKLAGDGHACSPNGEARQWVAALLSDCNLKPPRDLELLFACLAEVHTSSIPTKERVEQLLQLDESALAQGGRTQLQEQLLATYADVCGIEAQLK